MTGPFPSSTRSISAGCSAGDLGISIADTRPVGVDLAQYLPATVELASSALVIAIIIGVPTGIISAVYKDAWPDQVARVFALGGTSLPVFYVGSCSSDSFISASVSCRDPAS